MHSRAYPEQKTSNELALRARDLLPGRRSKKSTDLAPKYLERGRGCHVWDIDGNEYIDLIMGNGKQLLQLELFRHGVLWNGFHNLSASHKYKDISHVLSSYAEALSVLKCAVEAKQVREYITR